MTLATFGGLPRPQVAYLREVGLCWLADAAM